MTEPTIVTVDIPRDVQAKAICDALDATFTLDALGKLEATRIAGYLIDLAERSGVQIHEVRVYEPDYLRTFDPYIMVESRTQRDIWRGHYMLDRRWVARMRRAAPVERG